MPSVSLPTSPFPQGLLRCLLVRLLVLKLSKNELSYKGYIMPIDKITQTVPLLSLYFVYPSKVLATLAQIFICKHKESGLVVVSGAFDAKVSFFASIMIAFALRV